MRPGASHWSDSSSTQRERNLGVEARQLLRVADVIQARDPSPLDAGGDDAVELPCRAHDECWTAVHHGRFGAQSDPRLADAADDEASDPLSPDDRMHSSLRDPTSVGEENHLRGEHLKEALQVSGFYCLTEGTQHRAGLCG